MSYALDTRNYFDNGDAKKGTFNFSLFNTTFTNNVPTTITLGAAGLTLSAVTTNPLINKVSLQLVKGSAVNTQGQGIISSELRLNRGDLAKVLTWAFEYERVSGTLDLSGTSTSSFEIWIYDVQSATWQQPSGFRSMTQGTLGGFASGEFQTLSTATSVRVAIIYRQTDTNTWTVNFDDFQLVRNKPQRGSFISDWKSETLSAGSGFNRFLQWRRVGDELEGRYKAVMTGAGDPSLIPIPAGLTIDTTKYPNSATFLDASFGTGHAYDISANAFYQLSLGYNSTTNLFAVHENTVGAQVVGVASTQPFTWASGDILSVSFKVPIVGWSSTQVLSSDTDTRVVAASYVRNSSQSIPATTDTTLVPNLKIYDTHEAFNSSTGKYHCPQSGIYKYDTNVFLTANAVTGVRQLRIQRRNSAGTLLEERYCENFTKTDTNNVEISLQAFGQFNCNAGDTLETIAWTNAAGGVSTISGIMFTNVERISGPSQVAANEVVGFRAGGSVTSCGFGVFTTVVNPTVSINTHGAYNSSTGVFTAPVTGLYRFSGSVHWSNLTTSTTAPYIAAFYKNNVEVTNGNFAQRISNESCAVVTDLIQLNQGDTVDLRAYQADSSPNARALSGNAARNNFSGQKVN